jgi:RNA polymerase sigma-70 factor (ECF subfamily)
MPVNSELRLRSAASRRPRDAGADCRPHTLDPEALPDYIDHLYRAACGLTGSPHDAEDLVQETFAVVLRRPRLLRDNNELGYLLRALRNTFVNRYRAAASRPATVPLLDEDAGGADEPDRVTARELMQAIASAPPVYRDAVIAVDVVGLSYREAAHSLRTRVGTITTRVHRGRQHIARELRHASR